MPPREAQRIARRSYPSPPFTTLRVTIRKATLRSITPAPGYDSLDAKSNTLAHGHIVCKIERLSDCRPRCTLDAARTTSQRELHREASVACDLCIQFAPRRESGDTLRMAYQCKSLPSVCADPAFGAVKRLRRTGYHLAPRPSHMPWGGWPFQRDWVRCTTMLH